MVESARQTGLDEEPWFLQLDLGHVGVFRSLVEAARTTAEVGEDLHDALARRSAADISTIAERAGINPSITGMLTALVELNGDRDVIDTARRICAGHSEVLAAIDNLEQVADLCTERCANVRLHVDLAELRGYHYHTGVVFALYVPGHGQAVAQGGRYDDIGSSFGRPRPATGFSADLKEIMRIRRARGAFTEDG